MGKPYQPPNSSAAILESIQSLFANPKTQPVDDAFEGKTFMAVFPNGQLYFESKLDVDTDGSIYWQQDRDGAKINGQPTTSTKDAGEKSLDADAINYFVLPGGFYKNPTYGIEKGDVAIVIYGKRVAYACLGDFGPANKLGEGSIALHRALGHETIKDRDKRDGGTLIGGSHGGDGLPSGVITIVFPGTGKNEHAGSNAENKSMGERMFQQLKEDGYAWEKALLRPFRSRRIVIPAAKIDLEFKLLDWMQDLLDATPHPADVDAGYLVATAAGVDTILYAPRTTPMTLPGPGIVPDEATTVYADFRQDRTASGAAFVSRVRFHLNAAEQAEAVKGEADAAREELRERLLQNARVRQMVNR